MTTSIVCSLKMNFADDFEGTRIARRDDGPEGGAPGTAVRIQERWGVGHIETLDAQFKTDSFLKPERLANHQVRILKPRSSDRVTRAVPDSAACIAEGGCVEPLPRARIREVVRI